MGWAVGIASNFITLVDLCDVYRSSTHVIIDANQRLMVTLVGFPKDNSDSSSKPWTGVADGAATIIDTTRRREGISARRHRRGKFAALACGVSFGGGQEVNYHRL